MIERARQWLQARGLVGRKLYVLIGSIVALAVGLAAMTMTGKPTERSSNPPETSQAKPASPSLGALAPKALGEGAVDMGGDLGQRYAQERNNQRLGQVEKDLREAREEQKIMKSALDQILDWQKQKTQSDEQSRLSQESAFRDLKEQQEIRAREDAAGGLSTGPRKHAPLEIITVPKSKEEKPRSERGRPAENASTAAEPSLWLPAGSMVPATLLTGMECLPASGGPGIPVMFLLKDQSIGPNSSSLPVQQCMILGRCDADLSSERVKINATNLSCVFPEGRTLDRGIQGYVSGIDGRYGIPGRVRDKRGRKVGMAVLAGFTQGLAQAIGQSEVTRVLTAEGTERTVVSGSMLTFGMSQALSSALAEVTNFYRQQISSLMPIIEVQAGVEVTIILEHGVDVPELNNLFSESTVDPIR